MVRRLILATAVTLWLSSHCAADAVRRAHVVDPAEAKANELQAMAQREREKARLLKLTTELMKRRASIRIELLQEKDQEVRRQLRQQIGELDRQIEQVLEACKALRK